MKTFNHSPMEIVAQLDTNTGVVSIHPKDGMSYTDGTVILQSNDGGHISVVRNNGRETVPAGIKAYQTMIRELLEKDYVIINGTLDTDLVKKLGVRSYVNKLIKKK